MKKINLLFFLLTVFTLQAQLTVDDVKTFTLENGMKFLVVEDFSIPNANMFLFYKAGGRNEYQGITGISHFFEHMMFNGAKKYGPKQFDKTMGFYGGRNNAYTTRDMTVYTDFFPSDAIEIIFDLEADRISNLSFDPKMVKSERNVILSEKSTSIENNPFITINNAILATAFHEHPYRMGVIGYDDDIKNWTIDDLKRYHTLYYAPNNCVVVVSGALSKENVERLAKQYFEIIPSQISPPKVNIIEPEQKGERRIIVHRDVVTPYVWIAYHTPESNHEDYYALNILKSILGQGRSSRLQASLIYEKQLAVQVFAVFTDSYDPGLFNLIAVANKDVHEKDLELAIYAELKTLIDHGISDQELQKAKNQKLIEFYDRIETIEGKSDNLGSYELLFGDYKKLFDTPENYNKVTKDDVIRVVKKYFKKSNRTVGVLKSNLEN